MQTGPSSQAMTSEQLSAPADDPIEFSIGICAYNEEQNIERCIRTVFTQKLHGFVLKQILVVSSGSTDRTDEIVRSLAAEFPVITFLPQEKREGKNSAINLYLDNMTSKLAVMLNADNVFASEESLQKLLEPFRDPMMGMVGGHPIPTNDPSTKIGFASQMLWAMHHNVAMIYPKIGELVAFREIGTRLRTDLQSDEDIIRMKLEEGGYKTAYAEGATIYNRGPETEEDFLKQRVRVNIGEVTMKKIYDYDVPSWNKKILIKAYLQIFRQLGFHPFKMLYMTRLEFKARRLAREHVARGEDKMSCWDPVQSTKRL